MKMLVAATAIMYSSLTFAGYKCTEKDSNLEVGQTGTKVVTVLKVKGAQPVILKGTQNLKDATGYFNVKSFTLADSDGQQALMKIIQRPVMTRNPCMGRRICDEQNFLSNDITAELDYLGKVTLYDCTQTIL
jgi:hypothetical protein